MHASMGLVLSLELRKNIFLKKIFLPIIKEVVQPD